MSTVFVILAGAAVAGVVVFVVGATAMQWWQTYHHRLKQRYMGEMAAHLIPDHRKRLEEQREELLAEKRKELQEDFERYMTLTRFLNMAFFRERELEKLCARFVEPALMEAELKRIDDECKANFPEGENP